MLCTMCGEEQRTRECALCRCLLQLGFSFAFYQECYEQQEGRCGICQKEAPLRGKGRLMIDHDHQTHQARGLLCGPCNGRLALLGDSLELVTRTMQYLTRPPSTFPFALPMMTHPRKPRGGIPVVSLPPPPESRMPMIRSSRAEAEAAQAEQRGQIIRIAQQWERISAEREKMKRLRTELKRTHQDALKRVQKDAWKQGRKEGFMVGFHATSGDAHG